MNEAVEKFRKAVKDALYEKIEAHKTKTTYDTGVEDGLQLALAVVIQTPGPEEKGGAEDGN